MSDKPARLAVIDEQQYKGQRIALLYSGDDNLPLMPAVFLPNGTTAMVTDTMPGGGAVWCFAEQYRHEAWDSIRKLVDQHYQGMV